ncbi:MAG: hypothetical protein KC635_17875, partial [Myxococcales bacterium]|nr:hypothetical protein [Myxococcales bacterium]
MSDETKEHQLTAYLLGELSADERARVDAWLARDADARALLDELRGTIALLEGDLAAELAPEL